MMELEFFKLVEASGIDVNTLLIGWVLFKLHSRVTRLEWTTQDCCGD